MKKIILDIWSISGGLTRLSGGGGGGSFPEGRQRRRGGGTRIAKMVNNFYTSNENFFSKLQY